MSAVDPSGRVIVIPSSGGTALPTAAGANEVPASTGAGTTYAAVTVPALLAVAPSANRTALSAGQTDSDTPQLTSSTGWTITAMAAGSGAIAGGAYTATIPEGTTAATGAYATRTWPLADGVSWELQGRAQITSDTNAALLAGLRVAWSGGNYTIYLLGSGGLFCYRDGGWGFASQTIDGSGLPVDGTLWFRVRGEGTRLRVWRGIGSGSTAPTTWTLASDFTEGALLGSGASPAELGLFGFSNDTHTVPAGTTVVWRSLTVRSFDP